MREHQVLGWDPPVPTDYCNFHMRRPAVLRYAGTPLCGDCAERVGLMDPAEGARPLPAAWESVRLARHRAG